jgi:hypothetical protein
VRALDELDGADPAQALARGAGAYAAGRALARTLWALELTPEGAPLAAAAASEFQL